MIFFLVIYKKNGPTLTCAPKTIGFYYNPSDNIPRCHLAFDPGQVDIWQPSQTSAICLKQNVCTNLQCVQSRVGMVTVLQW